MAETYLTDADREALAMAIDRADDLWQHGIGASGYTATGPPNWLIEAAIKEAERIVRRHRAGAVRAAAAQLRDEMNTFPMQGAHTRAGWAVNRLADIADQIEADDA